MLAIWERVEAFVFPIIEAFFMILAVIGTLVAVGLLLAVIAFGIQTLL